MSSLFSLRGKIILVTGAAGLIGREICDAFVEHGARVVLTDLGPQDRLDQQARALAKKYRNEPAPLAIAADITNDAAVAALFSQISGVAKKRLDVLVNLAAIDAKFDDATSTVEPSRFENFPLDVWEKSVAVNCTGLLRVTQAAVRLMLPRRAGNIINVASTYSLVAPNQDLYRFAGEKRQKYKPVDYVATKSLVPNFTRYLATLYAREGLRANCIAPHAVDNKHSQKFRDNFARLSPLGRLCAPDELRGPFVFLASDASSYMTGSTLVVDGGWTAW
jgi:NAD(P)-dependent dehydrogenase (short-subunit alcohol dehydrogenase family)